MSVIDSGDGEAGAYLAYLLTYLLLDFMIIYVADYLYD